MIHWPTRFKPPAVNLSNGVGSSMSSTSLIKDGSKGSSGSTRGGDTSSEVLVLLFNSNTDRGLCGKNIIRGDINLGDKASLDLINNRSLKVNRVKSLLSLKGNESSKAISKAIEFSLNSGNGVKVLLGVPERPLGLDLKEKREVKKKGKKETSISVSRVIY